MNAQLIEILLVEDNPGDVDLTREALSEGKIGNNLHVVSDGEEAMDFLKKRGAFAATATTPDLVLLDLNLPRKDGRQVLEEIKNDPVLKKLPVVVLTTSDAEEDLLNSYEHYANCYIRKPVDFQRFVDVVKKIEEFWFSIVRLPKW